MPIKMQPPVSSLTGQPYAPPDLTGATSPLGMMGGIPEGLNPIALEETLKKFAPEAANGIGNAVSSVENVPKMAMDAFKNNQVSKYISNFFSNPTQQEAISRAIKGLK